MKYSIDNLQRDHIIMVFKHPLFIVFIANLILRIPYFTQPQGDDAFIVIWMAKAINNGYLDPWLINPLSIFGLYPYSFYPIGSLIILSFFFSLGFNFQLSLLCYSLLFMSISIFTSYRLGNLLFSNNRNYSSLFSFFFTTAPIFLRFTYWTSSVRGPFLAILPLAIYFNLMLIKDFSIKNLLYFILSIILLASMHRLVIVFPVYIIVIIIAYFLQERNLLKQRNIPIFLLIYLFLFIAGVLIFPIDFRKVTEFLLSNDTIIGVIWNLIIDYGLRIALISVLSIIGFITQFSSEEKSERSQFFNAFFLSLGFILVFITPISLYTSLIVLPWFAYYSVLGTIEMLKWQKEWTKYIVGFAPILFCFLYSMIVIPLPIHLIGSAILAIFTLFKIADKKYTTKIRGNHIFYSILCVSIILFTRVSVDGLITTRDFPYTYVSEDEIIIAEYLKEHNTNQEIIIVYHHTVARKIQGICFQPVLFTSNEPASVIYGWISIQDIIDNTNFNPFFLAKSGIPFEIDIEPPERRLRVLLTLDLNENSSVNILKNNSVRYVITDNSPSGYWFSASGNYQVPLLTSISENGILRVTTQHLCLFEIM